MADNNNAGDLESFLATKAKMPGYTGFSPGVRAVIGKPPAMTQALASATPRGGGNGSGSGSGNGGGATTALLLSTATTPRTNTTSSFTNLFPALQPPGPQPSARPGARAPARGAAPGVGDDEGSATAAANAQTTTTTADAFAPPSPAYAHVRSPMRNKELEAAGAAGAALLARYSSAHARVGGDAAVDAMMARMRARLLSKLTGAGDNAFRLRRLFRAYDSRPPTGQVTIEEFRQMGESFGLQLGDDVLLALFFRWDPQGTGSLPYEPLVAALLADGDAFALYAPAKAAAEGAQGAADKRAAREAARAIVAAARGGAPAVRRVLAAMAEDERAQAKQPRQEGKAPPLTLLHWSAFVAGLASVCVALSPQQQAFVRDARQGFVHATGTGLFGTVDWMRFCDALDDVAREG